MIAEVAHCADGADRNDHRDKCIFNRRSALLAPKKFTKAHRRSLPFARGCRSREMPARRIFVGLACGILAVFG